MKFLSPLVCTLLVLSVMSTNIFSEENQAATASCEQQATDLGAEPGEEFDLYVSDCVSDANGDEMFSSDEEPVAAQ